MTAATAWAADGLARSRRQPLPLPTPADGHEPGSFDALLRQAAARAEPGSRTPDGATGSPTASPIGLDDVHEAGVIDLVTGYRAGWWTPSDVVAALGRRITARGGRTGAVLRVLNRAAEQAELSTRRWQDGTARALEGVPFGVKDVLDVAGELVTSGSRVTGRRIAPADATAVARWRAVGAVPVAVLATSEFACGAPDNGRYGAVRNPWDDRRWSGGSSTGSGAALADRLVPLALGTDTGGSVRLPSAWCGTTGLKPTYGLVPRTGVATLSWSLDHVGPMARSAADLALVLPHLAGADGIDPTAAAWPPAGSARERAEPAGPADLAGLRVAVPTGWFLDVCDTEVRLAWEQSVAVLQSAGARVVPVDEGPLQTLVDEAWTVLYAELASGHEGNTALAGLYDTGLLDRFSRGLVIGAADYLRALRRRAAATQEMVRRCFSDADVLLTPGPGARAPLLADLLLDIDGELLPMLTHHSRNTMPFDLTGLPALMLPSGIDRMGMPVAVQVVAPHFRDDLCLRVGRAFQNRTGHHLAMPTE